MKLIAVIALTIVMNTCGNKNTKIEPASATVTTDLLENDNSRQTQNELVLEYTEETRGAYRQIKATKNNISTLTERDGTPTVKPITESQWQNITKLLEQLNVDGFSELKAPSNKRFADAALMARLKVSKGENTYTTPDFDNNNPMSEIKELVEQLKELSK